MLKEGKIDLLSDVSFLEERTKHMLYSNYAMGVEKYFLYAPANSPITTSGIKLLEGKKVGVNKGSLQAGLFKKWEEQMGVQAQLIELVESDSLLTEKLRNGELDAVVNGDGYEVNDLKVPLVEIGSSDIFFAVNKKRSDLLEDLNHAMAAIYRANNFYNQDLYQKYIFNQGANQFLGGKELDWLKGHSTIKVGYRDNYMAFCAKDEKTGELKGALKDYLDMLSAVFKNATIKFEPVAYASVQEALDAMNKGEVECVFPVSFGPYDAERKGVLTTKSIASSDAYAVIHKENINHFSLNRENVVAVNRNNPNFISFLQDHFPKWKIQLVENTDEALKAVAQGRAEATLVSNIRLRHFESKMERMDLFSVTTNHVMRLSFATRRDNLTFYSILNHGIAQIPQEDVNAVLTSNTLLEMNTSVLDFIKQNALKFLFVGSLISLVIVVLLIRTFKSEIKYKNANRNLEEIQDNLKVALASAQEANKAKTMFLNSMSHDIRTPMNGIIGMTAIASSHIDDTERVKDCLHKISGASDHLLSLINDVLDVSRIESGRTVLGSEPFDIAELLTTLSTMVMPLANQKKQALVLNTNGLRTTRVVGDPLRLRQIILNIVSNAIKYTPEGGIIQATVRESSSTTSGFVNYMFTCEDNGLGMDPEFVDKIFEPFSRDEQDDNKRAIQGTGLGMSIARSLARMMDGDIRVESATGKGTRVDVSFKMKVGDEASSAVKEETSVEDFSRLDFSDKRILLVEDNELNMEIAKEFFSLTNVKLDAAFNGKEAFSLFEGHEAGYYDMIFMDIQMPVMDGHQATRAVRNAGKADSATIPIVAMSANAFAEDMESSKRSGMNDHIAKPINVAKLMGLMKKYLG